jgi:hypothetical protein
VRTRAKLGETMMRLRGRVSAPRVVRFGRHRAPEKERAGFGGR